MKMNLLFLIVALLAVVVALFAWAVTASQNASRAKWLRRKLALLPIMFRQPESFGGVQFANIGEGTHEHGRKTYIPAAATSYRYLFYEVGADADHCVIAAGTNEPIGSSDDMAEASVLDEGITIILHPSAKGTHRATCDGTPTNLGRIALLKDGTGRVALLSGMGTGTFWVVGRAIVPTDAVIAANDAVEFVPFTPYQVSQ